MGDAGRPVDPGEMSASRIEALFELCPAWSNVYATKNVFAGGVVAARREGDGQWLLLTDAGGRVSSRRLAEMVHGTAWSVATPQYGGV